MATMTQSDIEHKLASDVVNGYFRKDTVEMQGVSFRVDKPYFWKDLRNEDYIKAEIEWYNSTSPFVTDLFKIYGKPVQIWEQICDAGGKVNSNYGARIYDTRHGAQYYNAVEALKKDPFTRQAIMIYQDPWMHQIAGKDFTCTNTVQYFMNKIDRNMWSIDAHVYMRSNDAIFGFNNDYAWQKDVLRHVAWDMHNHEYEKRTEGAMVLPGEIHWHCASFHVYERHFDVLEKWWEYQ